MITEIYIYEINISMGKYEKLKEPYFDLTQLKLMRQYERN